VNAANKGSLTRGEYYTVSRNALLTDNVEKYFGILEKADPGYYANVVDHYRNKLTHDGKGKPRHEITIYDKAKKWIRSWL
jgi:hypothetical protein